MAAGHDGDGGREIRTPQTGASSDRVRASVITGERLSQILTRKPHFHPPAVAVAAFKRSCPLRGTRHRSEPLLGVALTQAPERSGDSCRGLEGGRLFLIVFSR